MKPISIILQGQEILASYTDHGVAIAEFKALEPNGQVLSLHVLRNPDRVKGKRFVIENIQPAPRPTPKRNKESLL